jgi:hypothetical protein
MIVLAPVSTVLALTRGEQPAQVIDREDGSQRDFWAARLGVSSKDLSDAIDKVGPSVAAVRRHLGK